VTFVESDPKTAQLLRRNLTACQLLETADIYQGKVDGFLDSPNMWNGPYDVVFADPPYAAGHEVELLRQAWATGLIAEDGLMVIEQDAKAQLPETIEHALLRRRYLYGDTTLWLYGPTHSGAAAP
jgi:16S rRNA G966 N2-methylase RsmD